MSRHPNSARFHELLAEAGELHDAKQADYGRDHDPFANVRATEEWGIPAWVGAMVRLNDKVQRLKSLVANGSLNNEAATDSFMDIAVYALIARVLYEQEGLVSAGAEVVQRYTPEQIHEAVTNVKEREGMHPMDIHYRFPSQLPRAGDEIG